MGFFTAGLLRFKGSFWKTRPSTRFDESTGPVASSQAIVLPQTDKEPQITNIA